MTPLDLYMNERWTVAGVSKTRYEVYVDLYGPSVNYGHYGDAELWLKAWGKRETETMPGGEVHRQRPETPASGGETSDIER